MNAKTRPATLAGLILAVAVGSAIAHLCTSALPFQVGSLIDGFGLSATGAGLVGFFQVGALAVSMILFSPIAHRFHPLLVCLCGVLLAACSNGLVYRAPPSLPLLCFLATLIGVGYGLILTAAVAAAAGSPQPDKIYAAGISGSLLIVVIMMSALPIANRSFGARGTFLAIPLLIVACIPLLLGFRAGHAGKTDLEINSTTFLAGMPLLIIWALFSFGTGAMWAFTERVGAALGLPPTRVGLVLSMSPFAGLVGTSLAAFCSGRLNRLTMLAVGLVGGGATCLMFAVAPNLWVFTAAAILYWVSTMFVYVLLLGTAALLDRTGRLGTLGTGCERLAFAVGAPIGGLTVDFGSLRWVGFTATVACALVAPCFLSGLGRILRRSRVDARAAAPAQAAIP